MRGADNQVCKTNENHTVSACFITLNTRLLKTSFHTSHDKIPEINLQLKYMSNVRLCDWGYLSLDENIPHQPLYFISVILDVTIPLS